MKSDQTLDGLASSDAGIDTFQVSSLEVDGEFWLSWLCGLAPLGVIGCLEEGIDLSGTDAASLAAFSGSIDCNPVGCLRGGVKEAGVAATACSGVLLTIEPKDCKPCAAEVEAAGAVVLPMRALDNCANGSSSAA